MTFEQALAFGLVAVTIGCFIWGRFRYDLISLGALLAAVALSSAAGCSLENSARDDRASLSLGMTADEVKAVLGDPSDVTREEAASGPTWHYIYAPGSGRTLEIFAEVATVVGVVGAIVALVFRGGSLGGLQGSSSKGFDPSTPRSWRFSLRFDPDGRVAEISELR